VIPQKIPVPDLLEDVDKAICGLAGRWMITEDLSRRLSFMAERLPFGLSIISGHRTASKQLQLGAEGRPTAQVDRSTHTSCPATGADLWPGVAVTRVVQATFGEAAVVAGLRWGGGSPIDPDTGIPSDWNHVDLGPRSVS